MANKKASKNVIEYDPLAWLDDSADAAESDDSISPKKVAVKKSVTKKAVKKKSVKKSVVKKISVKKTVSKKSVSKKKVDVQKEDKVMTNENEDDPGFGFFDDAPSEEVIAESVEEDDVGYGFFDASVPLESQSAELDNATNVISFGAELTIRSVSSCKALIDESISNGFDVKIAAGDLQKIDTAGLQLIYSLKQTLEKSSQEINWISSNSIINDSAQLIGMPKLLDSSDDEGAYGFFNDDPKSENDSNKQEETGFGFF